MTGVVLCDVCGGPVPGLGPTAGYLARVQECGCTMRLERYHRGQVAELKANRHKGGRRGWVQGATPNSLLGEVHRHVAKLHVVMCELNERRIGAEPREVPWDGDLEDRVREFAYDTGNMSMMLLDNLGLLEQ